MTPDADQHTAAVQIDGDPCWLCAMVVAEGGPDAFVRAVNCSVAVDTYQEALHVGARTLVHAMSDYLQSGRNPAPGMLLSDFVQFFGARWAPIGASNDPTNLNANWPKNVLAAFHACKGTE